MYRKAKRRILLDLSNVSLQCTVWMHFRYLERTFLSVPVCQRQPLPLWQEPPNSCCLFTGTPHFDAANSAEESQRNRNNKCTRTGNNQKRKCSVPIRSRRLRIHTRNNGGNDRKAVLLQLQRRSIVSCKLCNKVFCICFSAACIFHQIQILATVESSNSFVTSMVNTPVLLIQPLNTLLSGCTSLGTDSPVSAEVSKKRVPSAQHRPTGFFSRLYNNGLAHFPSSGSTVSSFPPRMTFCNPRNIH